MTVKMAIVLELSGRNILIILAHKFIPTGPCQWACGMTFSIDGGNAEAKHV